MKYYLIFFLNYEFSYFFKGLFKESRHVECSDPDGNVHDDHELCNEVQKPESVRDCETENDEVRIHYSCNDGLVMYLPKLKFFINFLRYVKISGLLLNGVFAHQNVQMSLEYKLEMCFAPLKMTILP